MKPSVTDDLILSITKLTSTYDKLANSIMNLDFLLIVLSLISIIIGSHLFDLLGENKKVILILPTFVCLLILRFVSYTIHQKLDNSKNAIDRVVSIADSLSK
jgi:Na+/glutamate symporter